MDELFDVFVVIRASMLRIKELDKTLFQNHVGFVRGLHSKEGVLLGVSLSVRQVVLILQGPRSVVSYYLSYDF